MNYLKDENYYSDLYDLRTVKECLDNEKFVEKHSTSEHKPKRGKPIKITFDFFTYYIKGQRFVKKVETINEWMRKDKEKDDRVEKSTTPQIFIVIFVQAKWI